MSEAKIIIAESIIENFEAVSSYVARQSLRDMVDENQALRDEVARLRGTLESLARHSVIAGSRGEYRQGQLDVLESVHRIAKAALTPQAGKGGGE